MAISCKDIHGEVERLRSEGIEFETDVDHSKSVGALSYAFSHDPDGAIAESVEFHR